MNISASTTIGTEAVDRGRRTLLRKSRPAYCSVQAPRRGAQGKRVTSV